MRNGNAVALGVARDRPQRTKRAIRNKGRQPGDGCNHPGLHASVRNEMAQPRLDKNAVRRPDLIRVQSRNRQDGELRVRGVGACLGIPGITAHRAVFGDGPVRGQTVLVQGVLGGVGSLAAQLARWGGATVISTVRRRGDLGQVPAWGQAVALDEPDPARAIQALAPGGVNRIIEVAFSDNVDLDAAVAANQAVIAAYATRQDRSGFAFWPMLFDNITIRLLGSDDFLAAAKQQAAADLTAAARAGALSVTVDALLPLEQAAQAHDRVDQGARGRVLLTIPE